MPPPGHGEERAKAERRCRSGFSMLLRLVGVSVPSPRRAPAPAAAPVPEISTGPRADVVAQTL